MSESPMDSPTVTTHPNSGETIREQNAFAYGCIAAALQKPLASATEYGFRARTAHGDAFERGWQFVDEALSCPAASLGVAQFERYWCGCVRHAQWVRCSRHGDLPHDEEPPTQRQQEGRDAEARAIARITDEAHDG